MRKFHVLAAMGLMAACFIQPVAAAEKGVLPSVKDTSVTIPVEEFSKFVKDAKISLPWADFEKIITTDGTRHIRLPWEMFLEYIDPGMAVKPPKPPVDYTLSSFLYTGSPEKNSCTLNFSASLTVLKDPADGWTTVKLWPANNVFLSSLSLNGKPANIVNLDNFYQVMVNQQGSYRLEGELQVKLSGESLRINPPLNSGSLLKLSLPGNYDVNAYSASSVKLNRTKDATDAEVSFPPYSEVMLNWNLMAKEPAEPKILATATVSSSIQADIVRTTASIRYEILYQPVQFLKINVPEGVRVNNVTGNLLDWKQTGSLIQVELKPQTKGAVNIIVSYEQDLKAGTTEISLSGPEVADVEKTTGYLTVSSIPNIEIGAASNEGLSVVDPREVPGAGPGTILALRFNRLPFSAGIKLVRHEEMPVLEATADSANAITAVTPDGKTITRVIFNIRNNSKQFLQVKLPANGRLWSVYVGESPTKPLAGPEGKILIPVLKPGTKSDVSLPVEVIYYMPGSPFGKSGDFQATLPAIDIPIMHFMYSLYVPDRLRLENFGGNMEKVAEFALPAEREKSDLPDKKRVSDGGSFVANKPEASPRQSIVYLEQQMRLESNVGADSFRGRTGSEERMSTPGEPTAGLLPLRVYIPATGQLLRFEKRLVIEEDVMLKARYRFSDRGR